MRNRIRGRLAEGWDRVLASDPGGGRLSMALAASVTMGTTLGVELLLGRLTGAGAQGTLVSMLLGAMMAMMGSNALVGPELWGKVRTAAFFPVAIGAGMLLGVLLAPYPLGKLVGFVAVMFAAVFVRRFGLPFFFYGFMAWMGYFFASFVQAQLSMVPGLLVAVVVATAWVLLLSVTVFRTKPRTALRSTLTSFVARARSVARECADLLEPGDQSAARRARLLRRLGARQAGLAEAALMAEAWSEDPRSMPGGWSAPALRRRLIETQQSVDRMAAAAVHLAGEDPTLVAAAHLVLDGLAQRQDGAAVIAAQRLGALADDAERDRLDGWWPARHLSVAVLDFLDLDGKADDPPEVEPVDAEFEATAQLVFGNLPGAPAVARDVRARGFRWNPLTRLDLTSRQAVQVSIAGALAIALGQAVSPTRYYWAVIAAFVTFTGTATRSETFLKGFNRVLGTLLGLVASIVVAHLTSGHTGWTLATILGSVFLGFYLIRVAYAWMIFFITIMLGQLYTVLGTFSDQLLVLRLEETAVGALAGFVVALVVTPLSTRDTVRSVRDELLTALAELLEASAAYADGAGSPDLDAYSRALDEHARRLGLVTKPLTRPLVLGNHSPRTRHRLSLYVSTAAHARSLTVALRLSRGRSRGRDATTVAAACRALGDAATGLQDAAPGRPAPATFTPLEAGDQALFGDRAHAATDPVLRPLVRLHATLTELAATSHPAGGPAARLSA